MRCSNKRRNQQEEQREGIHINLEKSSKTIFIVKMSQAKPPFIVYPPPPTSSQVGMLRQQIFHVVRANVRVAGAKATHHGDSQVGGGGRGDLRMDTIRYWLSDLHQIQHEDGQRYSAPLLF
jgi:hypothetical protein